MRPPAFINQIPSSKRISKVINKKKHTDMASWPGRKESGNGRSPQGHDWHSQPRTPTHREQQREQPPGVPELQDPQEPQEQQYHARHASGGGGGPFASSSSAHLQAVAYGRYAGHDLPRRPRRPSPTSLPAVPTLPPPSTTHQARHSLTAQGWMPTPESSSHYPQSIRLPRLPGVTESWTRSRSETDVPAAHSLGGAQSVPSPRQAYGPPALPPVPFHLPGAPPPSQTQPRLPQPSHSIAAAAGYEFRPSSTQRQLEVTMQGHTIPLSMLQASPMSSSSVELPPYLGQPDPAGDVELVDSLLALTLYHGWDVSWIDAQPSRRMLAAAMQPLPTRQRHYESRQGHHWSRSTINLPTSDDLVRRAQEWVWQRPGALVPSSRWHEAQQEQSSSPARPPRGGSARDEDSGPSPRGHGH